jgi:hypothetical protein
MPAFSGGRIVSFATLAARAASAAQGCALGVRPAIVPPC